MRTKFLPDYCISGRALEEVGGIVVHYFSGKNVDPENQFELQVCYNLFLDLNRPKVEREFYMQAGDQWLDQRMYASAHVLIGRDGEIWKLIEYDKQAYHAGASIMHGREHCNRWTLGVELLGHQDSGFSKAQYLALAELVLELEEEFGFSRDNVAGHDFVRWAAIQAGSRKRPKYDPSGRKDGEGDNFDWFYLGKLMNDSKENPEGVAGLESLSDVLESDPLSE